MNLNEKFVMVNLVASLFKKIVLTGLALENVLRFSLLFIVIPVLTTCPLLVNELS